MSPANQTVFLCAVDGSEGSRRAARYAADRARAESATLRLVHVIDWSPYEVMDVSQTMERHTERAHQIAASQKDVLDPLKTTLGDDLTIETKVDFGHPAEIITEMAAKGVTQVFCGRRGRSKLSAMLFGSVAGSLVQACPVPLTVVP